MTLFDNHAITTSSSPFTSPLAAFADQKGTQIPRTLRERRGIKWFLHFESYTLAGGNDDKGLAQPKGHLQPTVMNIPRRRRIPAKAAPIDPIPTHTPLSSPCTPLSPAYIIDHEGTQNHPRTPRERRGVTSFIYFEHAKFEESQKGSARPKGQLPSPAMTREVSSKESVPIPHVLGTPCTPSSDSTESDVELNGGLPRTLRDKRGVTFFIHFEPRKLIGWPKQRGPQPKGHLEPTVVNLPRRHKRDVYGPMVHSRLPCNFY